MFCALKISQRYQEDCIKRQMIIFEIEININIQKWKLNVIFSTLKNDLFVCTKLWQIYHKQTLV